MVRPCGAHCLYGSCGTTRRSSQRSSSIQTQGRSAFLGHYVGEQNLRARRKRSITRDSWRTSQSLSSPSMHCTRARPGSKRLSVSPDRHLHMGCGDRHNHMVRGFLSHYRQRPFRAASASYPGAQSSTPRRAPRSWMRRSVTPFLPEVLTIWSCKSFARMALCAGCVRGARPYATSQDRRARSSARCRTSQTRS